MIKITKEKALLLHRYMKERTGGADGLRSEELLLAALEAPFMTFDQKELYPTVEEKAARLCHSLISNHPFADGNKRIGMFIMLIFLKLNSAYPAFSPSDVERIGLALASGEMGYEELLLAIRLHKK